MRLEDAGPRTWLLAALAGWALLAWLLALGGMGGRLQPLPADPDLLQPLPPLRPAPPLRLGPIEQYRGIAERPLFAADRRPHPFFLEGSGEATGDGAFDYVLTSVLITPRLKMAILQPADGGGTGDTSLRVRLDGPVPSHPGWRLVGLDERSAVLAGPEGERRLELRVFNGVGGAPPTRVSTGDDRVAGRRRIPLMVPEPGGSPAPNAVPAPSTPPPDEAADDTMDATPPDDDETATPPKRGEAEPSPPMTEQAQMEAIRARIQERREQLRRQSEQNPPAKSR